MYILATLSSSKASGIKCSQPGPDCSGNPQGGNPGFAEAERRPPEARKASCEYRLATED